MLTVFCHYDSIMSYGGERLGSSIIRKERLMRQSRAATALRDLVLEVFRLNGALLRHGAALTAPMRQTQARWQVIGAVGEAECTVPQIARRMGMTRQSVQRIVDLLVDEGMLVLGSNPDHVRSPLVRLTREGRRLEQELSSAGVTWSESITRGLKADDIERTARVIRDIIARLDEFPMGGVPRRRKK